MSGHPTPPNTTYQELTGRELALNGAVGRARKVVVNGRDYLVAPMTLIVPGVLAGSMGPLYYPPEEIARDYQAWNGMPLVRLHPTRNGSPVSGRQPDVMGTEEMGRVYNARIGTGGRLQAEAWFDVEATRRVDPSILERLAKGDPIELSTGLFTVNHPERGVHNGRPYVAVARDYRPDHLAVLPDRTGACSLRDGCGILINQRTTGVASMSQPGIDLTPVATADLLEAVTNAFCPTGKGGGIKTDCSPKGGAARGGRGATASVKTGAAFTSKGAGTRSKGVATKASAAPARKAGEAAAPAKKPARQVKVSRSEMKAAKKLDAARKAALAKGDQETAAKATAKLKRIVERADARAAGSTKVGKGAVGRKLEAKAKEAAMKQAEDKRLVKERKARAKGYKDSNARRKDLIEKREMARVKRADAKANPKKNALAEKDKVAKEQGYKDYKDKNAKGRGFKDAEDRRKHAITVREQARVARADRKAAAKAAATKAEATKTKTEVDKVGREVRSRGRESKAAAKYVKAGVEAAAKGDQKKLSKVVEKVRKLKEKAEKRAARNEETPHELYSFIANELGFVSAADRLKRLAEDTFDLLDYHLVGNVLFTAPNRLAAELHKLVQVANEAQITVNHVQGRAEYEWLLGPVVNRGGRPIEYDGRPIAPTAAERSRLARNAKKRKMQPSDKLKKQGMTPEKACKIMEDGKTNGHWLTKDQKGMFGALCGERKEKSMARNAKKGSRDPQFAACIAACNKARGDDMPAPEESGSVGGNRIAVKNDYPTAVANLFGPAVPTPPTANNGSVGCGCGAVVNGGLTTNCGADGMCGPCAAKKAAAGKAMEVRVQNAQRCEYCGTMVKNGGTVCPKCGMVMGMAGDGPKTNPAEPYKLMENANPTQARGYRGQWENNDKAAIYHAVRKAFGGNDPAPIPAMSDTPGQAAPTSDPGQDAEAEAAHSVSNMLARVYNSLKKRMGMGGKDEDGDEKGEKHRARTGCGY